MIGALRKFAGGALDKMASYKFFFLVAGLHLTVALIYKDVVGLNIEVAPEGRTWGWFWQTLPRSLLENELGESIWYLHSQPPLYNLYGAFFFDFFPADPVQAIHYANILLGSLLSGMIFSILREITRAPYFALVVALLIALNPALFLYEAYLLYTLLAAFLVVLSVFFLARYSRTRKLIYIFLTILGINLLVLTRSVYHLFVLVPVILLGVVLARTEWKKVLVVGALISMLAGGWYAKNYLVFGFFGASSWDGMGLWKIASATYTEEELNRLAEDGVIGDMVVDVDVFSTPSAYRPYGFNGSSSVEALSMDDFNNINVPKISDAYQRNAMQLIRHNPPRYLEAIFYSYLKFSRPSSRFKHLPLNAQKMALHEVLVSQILQGELLARRFPIDFGALLFLLPASLLLYFLPLLRHYRLSPSRWIEYVRKDSVILFAAFLIVYTTAVACVAEAGENDRFKFLVEQLLWAFIAAVAYRNALRLPIFRDSERQLLPSGSSHERVR